MIPPAPFTRKVAPIRSGATSCTLLAKKDFFSRRPGFRNPSERAVSAELSIQTISMRHERNVPGGSRNFHVGRGIETITPCYLCGCARKLNVAAISTHRGRRHRYSLGLAGSSNVGFIQMETY